MNLTLTFELSFFLFKKQFYLEKVLYNKNIDQSRF